MNRNICLKEVGWINRGNLSNLSSFLPYMPARDDGVETRSCFEYGSAVSGPEMNTFHEQFHLLKSTPFRRQFDVGVNAGDGEAKLLFFDAIISH